MTTTQTEIQKALDNCWAWNNPGALTDLRNKIYKEHGLLLELEVNKDITDTTKGYCIEDTYGRKVYQSKHKYMDAVSAWTQGLWRLQQMLGQEA